MLKGDRFKVDLQEEIYKYLARPPKSKLHLGFCHGDLTFSNILFDENKRYLIDFLDTFVESPVQDIVKYRQDTLYGWSLMLEKNLPMSSRNKLTQIMLFLDQVGQAVISEVEEVANWYKYLQVFNLLRILPYLSDQEEIIFVEQALDNIL
jgi:hypothetical protein